MRKRKSIVSVLCACAMVLGVLNCGSVVFAEEDPIVIRYMTWEDGDWQNFTQEFVDKYMEENPGVVIQYEPVAGAEYMPKLQAALVAGNAPDVMWVDQWVNLFANDMFEDIIPLAEAAGYDLTTHNEQHLQMSTYNDKLYGLTGWAGVPGVVFNKQLFDEAGLEYPEYGWTWEQCYEAAEKITQGEGADKIYGISLPNSDFNSVENILWNGNAYVIDENTNYEGVLNSDEMVEGLDWFTSFVKNGLAPDPSSLDALGGDEEMFKQGKVAMIIKTSGYVASVETNGGFDMENMGTVCLPVKEEGMTPAVNTLLTNPICISKNSEHKEEAFKFLAARVGIETQTDFCSRGWTMPNSAEIVENLGLMDKPLYATYGDTIVNTDKYVYPKGAIAYSPMAAEIIDNFLNCINKIYVEDDVDIKAELDKVVANVAEAEANK